ncbi:MAG: hypothetical protein GF331_06185 [Chitinivibrionales bacterium]|nr:hypothetical protein [Chitinivibrionales bacterium]
MSRVGLTSVGMVALFLSAVHVGAYVAQAPTNDLEIHGYVIARCVDTETMHLISTRTNTVFQVIDRRGFEAVFSPDGTKLAFAVMGPKIGVKGSIWVSNTDGTNQHKVADCVSELRDGYILNWTANNRLWWSEGGNTKDQNMYVLDMATGIKSVYWTYEPQDPENADGIYKLCVSRDEKWAASMVHGGGWGFTYDLQAKELLQRQGGGCNGALSGLGAYYMTGVTQGGMNPEGYVSFYMAGRLWDAQTGETVSYCTVPGFNPGDEYDGSQIRDWRFSHHSDEYALCRGAGTTAHRAYLYEVLTNRYQELPQNHYYPSDFWPGELPGVDDNPVPEITLSTPTLSFADDDASLTQTLTVTNGVSGTTLGAVSVTPAGSPSWLTATQSGSGNAQTVSVTVDPAGLAAGAYSATVSVTGGGADVPATFTVTFDVGSSIAAPTGLTASAPAPRTVNLSWTDNADNETGFVVERRTQSSPWQNVATTVADATTHTDSDIDPNTYEYRVKAVGNGAESGYCAPATVSVLGDKSITIISPNASTPLQPGSTVTVVWDATDVGTVLVYYSANFGESWVLLNPGDDVATNDPRWANFAWTVPHGDATAYLVQVRDYSDQNVSGTSQDIPVAPSAVNAGPARRAATNGVQAIRGTGAQVDITFAAPGGEQVSIEVFDLTGKELFDTREIASGGSQTVSWRPAVSRIGAGRYTVRFHCAGIQQTRSFVAW